MYKYGYLFNFTRNIFLKMGCSEHDSDIIAEIFLAAELRGHASHGMIRIKDYFELWNAKRINVNPDITIVHESPSTAVVKKKKKKPVPAGLLQEIPTISA